MKQLFDAVLSFLESMGRARAASHFSRIGDYDSAKKIISE